MCNFRTSRLFKRKERKSFASIDLRGLLLSFKLLIFRNRFRLGRDAFSGHGMR